MRRVHRIHMYMCMYIYVYLQEQSLLLQGTLGGVKRSGEEGAAGDAEAPAQVVDEGGGLFCLFLCVSVCGRRNIRTCVVAEEVCVCFSVCGRIKKTRTCVVVEKGGKNM